MWSFINGSESSSAGLEHIILTLGHHLLHLLIFVLVRLMPLKWGYFQITARYAARQFQVKLQGNRRRVKMQSETSGNNQKTHVLSVEKDFSLNLWFGVSVQALLFSSMLISSSFVTSVCVMCV